MLVHIQAKIQIWCLSIALHLHLLLLVIPTP